MEEKIVKDFRNFAVSNANVSPSFIDDYIKKSMITPSVIEEKMANMRVVEMNVFSRLMYDRIIFLQHEVDADSCNTVAAQLLYLSSLDDRDINIYINTPGGSVVDGLMLIDTMNYIKNDITTTCMGTAASMGAVILSNGTKGKRFVLPHSRVMIHSVSSGFRGHTADVKIEMEQTIRCQNDLYKILAGNTGKSFEEIEQLCDRDNWFIGEEAVKLGIADRVLTKSE